MNKFARERFGTNRGGEAEKVMPNPRHFTAVREEGRGKGK